MARWSLEVLSTKGRDRERWKQYVTALPDDRKDVFFLPEYGALYEDVYQEPAFLFRYGDNQNTVLMVSSKRSIADLPFYRAIPPHSTPAYYDITSPYGYGGPVIHSQDKSKQTELFAAFRNGLHDYCLENGIVTEFQRLNPVMQNHRLFGDDPGLYQKNYIVWMDLRRTESEIFSGMRKDHRRNVGKALRKGVEVVRSDLRPDHVKEFYNIYTSSMERLKALSLFFLPLEFFEDLVTTLQGYVSLFFATWSGKIISAHLVFHCGPYIHNYLSGSDSTHWNLKPDVLITYKVALWAKAHGYKFFDLGGGHAVEMDSVFHFKSGFSSAFAPYYMYRCVHNAEAYAHLCRLKQEYDAQQVQKHWSKPDKDPLLVDYFPSYRG